MTDALDRQSRRRARRTPLRDLRTRPARGFWRLVWAELLKARLDARWWWQILVGIAVLSGMVAVTMGRAAATMVERGDAIGAFVFGQPDVATMGWTKVGLLALMVWAGTLVTSEVDTTLHMTWLAVPSRVSVLGVKAAIASSAAAFVTLLVMPLLLVAAHVGGAGDVLNAAAMFMVLKVAVGTGLLAVSSVGVAAATQSRAVVLVAWGLMLLSDETIAQIGALHGLGWFMPVTNLWHFSGVRVFETVTPPWHAAISFAWLALIAAAVSWLGGVRLRRP